MDRLQLYEYEGKIYILDGKNVWVYDGENIEKCKFVPLKLD